MRKAISLSHKMSWNNNCNIGVKGEMVHTCICSSKFVLPDFKNNGLHCRDNRMGTLKFTSPKRSEPQIDQFKSFTKNITSSISLRLQSVDGFISFKLLV